MAKKRISYKQKYEASQVMLEEQLEKILKLEHKLEVQLAETRGYRKSQEVSSGRTQSLTCLEIFIAFIGVVIAGLVGYQVYLERLQMQKQTDQLTKQTELIGIQNRLFHIQDSLFIEQNRRIDMQISLDSSQNDLFDEQNKQIINQNGLMGDQTKSLRIQDTLIYNQNILIKEQSDKIDLQIELSESDRRSSLVILMGNIMDQVNKELEKKSKQADRILKKETISRIIALSHALRPYISLNNGEPIKAPSSPERGQFLLNLANLGLNKKTYAAIYNQAIFKNADLKNGPMNNLYLYGVYLNGADMKGAHLKGANLVKADLSESNLRFADLSGANLSNANLINANLIGINLSEVNLVEADLRGANLNGGYLNKADLRRADFSGADLTKADLNGANLNGANLTGADISRTNLTGVDLNAVVFKFTILDSTKVSCALFTNKSQTQNNQKLDSLYYYYKVDTASCHEQSYEDCCYLTPRYPGVLQKRRRTWFTKNWKYSTPR